jgi:hypothetical protein
VALGGGAVLADMLVFVLLSISNEDCTKELLNDASSSGSAASSSSPSSWTSLCGGDTVPTDLNAASESTCMLKCSQAINYLLIILRREAFVGQPGLVVVVIIVGEVQRANHDLLMLFGDGHTCRGSGASGCGCRRCRHRRPRSVHRRPPHHPVL